MWSVTLTNTQLLNDNNHHKKHMHLIKDLNRAEHDLSMRLGRACHLGIYPALSIVTETKGASDGDIGSFTNTLTCPKRKQDKRSSNQLQFSNYQLDLLSLPSKVNKHIQ